LDRKAWAEKQSAHCGATREKIKSPVDFPPLSESSGGQPFEFFINEHWEKQPFRVSPATAFRVLLGAFFCCHGLVPQSVEERRKLV
jgi:hypothetical protein